MLGDCWADCDPDVQSRADAHILSASCRAKLQAGELSQSPGPAQENLVQAAANVAARAAAAADADAAGGDAGVEQEKPLTDITALAESPRRPGKVRIVK